MVINDEAHHIHELKRGGETEEVEWQKGLNAIAERKGERFFQIDFSATPYDTRGSGNGATLTDICDRCKVSLSAATGNLFA